MTGTDPALQEGPFFRSLTREQWARIAPLLVRRSFGAHQTIFLEGQPAHHAWLCAGGRIRLYKTSPDGRVTTLEVLGAGELFGAFSSLQDDEYTVSAEALEEVVLHGLARDVALRLIGENPRLAVEILTLVSRRLRAAQERVRSFATDAAPARLAQALLRAAPEGEARVTRRELAEAAGTTVETAIRVLRRFEKEGLVRSRVGRVRVLDRPGLEGEAAGHGGADR